MRGAAAPVVAVVGPTAAGKSDLALAIAGWCDGEVVSADAFQVYRGLDIGTAKVSEVVRARVPHHCIDLADPDQHFTAGDYARAAAAAVDDIRGRGRVAVLAGGSGFYLRALIDGLAPLPTQDAAWRAALEAIAARRGLPHLFTMLEALDPAWAAAVGRSDRQRLVRGLEVTLRSGRRMSVQLEEFGWTGPHYDTLWLALDAPRPVLHARIEARVDAMLAGGWLREVSRLLDAGYGAAAPGLRAIGYRELAAHLRGELSLVDARARIVRATRRYARRQRTWFRGQTPATWFELEADTAGARARLYDQVRAALRDRSGRLAGR